MLGLWLLLYVGDGWGDYNSDHKRAVFDAFKEVQNDMPRILGVVDNWITKAETLPEKCAYRKLLVSELKYLKGVLAGVQEKLETRSMPIEIEKVPSGLPRIAYARTPPFLKLPPSFFAGSTVAGSTILHELSHVERTDDGESKRTVRNAEKIQMLLAPYSPLTFAGELRNEMDRRKGYMCCPQNPEWPDN